MSGAGASPAAAPTGWLAVQAGEQSLLLPLAQCGEIHASAFVRRLPHTRPWLLGVVNLRGQVAAVVDLAAHLGLAPAPAPGDAQRGPLIALPATLGVPSALRVDALKGMRQAAALQPAPTQPPLPAWAQGAWQDGQGQVWFSIDVAQMTRQIGFIDVAA